MHPSFFVSLLFISATSKIYKRGSISFPSIQSYESITDQNDYFVDNYQWENKGDYGGIKNEDLNIKNVWKKNITGQNIQLSIADYGCRFTHEIFMQFNLNKSWNFQNDNINPRDLMNNSIDSQHGTSITGIASYASKKSIISHISLTTENSSKEISKFLESDTNNAIFSKQKINIRLFPNKFVNDPYFDLISDNNVLYDDSILCIFPAKNDGEHGSTIASSSRRAFIIGASTSRGFPAYYTGFSPATLVNAPSTGSEGYFEGTSLRSPLIDSPSNESDKSYYNEFGQTDAAAAEVAGALALAIESHKRNHHHKKSNLSYRDMMYMLILTSTINDPTSPKWKKNAADFMFHPNLGFGRINADLLVNVSSTWESVGPEITTKSIPMTLKKSNTLKINSVRENVVWIEVFCDSKVTFIEFVSLSFKTKLCTNNNNMKIQLISPSGTLFTVLYPTSTKPFDKPKTVINKKFLPSKLRYFLANCFTRFLRKIPKIANSIITESYQVGIRSFFGENGAGIWKVGFVYATYIPDDEVYDVSLQLYGQENRPILPRIKRKQAPISSIIDNTDLPTIKNAKFLNPPSLIKCGEQSFYYSKPLHKESYSAIFNLLHDEDTNNMTNLDIFLVNPQTYRTFPLGRTYETKSGADIPVSIPCIFRNNTQFLLSFRKNYKGLIASTTIRVLNEMGPKRTILNFFEPYSVQKIKREIFYSRYDSIETKDQPYFDHFIFSIYSVSGHEEVFSQSFTEITSFDFNFENLERDKYVLTITTPNLDDPCKAVMIPFNRFAFREFVVSLNNDCPSIDGIITAAVKNTIMIIAISAFLLVLLFLIITSIFIIIKLIKKRRNNFGELENISISTPMTLPMLPSN